MSVIWVSREVDRLGWEIDGECHLGASEVTIVCDFLYAGERNIRIDVDVERIKARVSSGRGWQVVAIDQ